MGNPTACCGTRESYCPRLDAVFGIADVHVRAVGWDLGQILHLVIETDQSLAGCPTCGVLATGRRARDLVDISCFDAPVRLTWLARRWRCKEANCPMGSWTETHPIAAAGSKLTRRAITWAISMIADDTALAPVARRLGVSWSTLCSAIQPVLVDVAEDPDRLRGVAVVGSMSISSITRPARARAPRN